MSTSKGAPGTLGYHFIPENFAFFTQMYVLEVKQKYLTNHSYFYETFFFMANIILELNFK